MSATHCMTNRIMVETAYATSAMTGEKVGGLEDLVEHGALPRMPKCPSGGTYTILPGADGEKATCVCSKHGSRIQARKR